MCTAVTYRSGDCYFGRTLDYEFAYPQQITVMPRKFPLHFRNGITMEEHYAVVGMAYVADGYPLYFDAVNEKGLAVAGLNFVGNAVYRKPIPGKENIASFELIPWILSRCATVAEAKKSLRNLNITVEAFREDLPPSQLHWIIADAEESITVESVKEGLFVYPNPVGVLTNNPTFPEQLFRLNDYMYLSTQTPQNHFAPALDLQAYSRGMGALGLPGDLSSQSRFVRAAFIKMNSVSEKTELASVSQFFHILGAVDQPRGCCDVGDGAYEITIYTACCNLKRGIYYYTTYNNHQITAVDMYKTDLYNSHLTCYEPITQEQIFYQNEL